MLLQRFRNILSGSARSRYGHNSSLSYKFFFLVDNVSSVNKLLDRTNDVDESCDVTCYNMYLEDTDSVIAVLKIIPFQIYVN